MNGGYLMISKTDSDIYAKAQKALVLGKPILFYENQTTCYYIDTISGGEITTEIVDDEEVTTYGDIILTKGGKTITISDANVVTESGSIIDNRMKDIVDSVGNKRFIEGSNEEYNQKVEYIYNKWSLSGTHLMIVCCGKVLDTTLFGSGEIYMQAKLPKFILDKISTLYSDKITLSSTLTLVSLDGSTTQTTAVSFRKDNESVYSNFNSSITLTADRIFRIQFDLLIDVDYSE